MSNMEEEIWKDVVGYEGLYQVSSLGRVKSVSRLCNSRYGKYRTMTGKVLMDHDSFGYRQINLVRDRKPRTYSVHRLVAGAFIPNPESKKCVHHINHKRHDNRVSNLAWVTHAENTKYAVEFGAISVGEKSTSSKITKKQAQEIIEALMLTQPVNVSRDLGVSHRTVQHIYKKNSWAHLSRDVTFPIYTSGQQKKN